MTLPDGPSPIRRSAQGSTEPLPSEGDSDVAGNKRLIALVSAVLLVLIVVALVTTATLHTLLSAHIFVGVLLVGPLAVKIGSTGYRFARYYTGSPAFVRDGPPRLALRVLAPLLLATTLVLIGSGIGLLVTGPSQPGPLLALHAISTLIWLPMIAIHGFAYARRIPRLIANDWWEHPATPTPGRRLRLGVTLGALLAGATAAILVLPATAPWVAWVKMTADGLPSPLLVGMVAAILALIAVRPLRWR